MNRTALYLILSIVIPVLAVGLFFLWPKSTEPALNTNTVNAANVSPVALYYGNVNENPDAADCSLVYPVERSSLSGASVESAMSALVSGPTEGEKSDGFTSQFSARTAGTVRSVRMANGTVFVDFTDLRPLLPNASASCASTALLAEIEMTLRQFSGVDTVVLAINGSSQDFYEWLQLSCPAASNNCNPSQFQ